MTTHTIAAYRLGHLPEQGGEPFKFSSKPAITMEEASRLCLPTGPFFKVKGDDLVTWLGDLLRKAKLPPNDLERALSGLDLNSETDRWYLLTIMMEKSRFRALVEGKENESEPVRGDPGTPLSGYQELLDLLATYDLRLSRNTRPNQRVELHAYRRMPPRCRIYIGVESHLYAGQLCREDVIARLESRGLRPRSPEEASGPPQS
jgi:hypothetical protein